MTHRDEAFFFKTKAMRIEQPLGVFYAAVIPANLLLEVCFADRLKAERDGDTYALTGAQRKRVEGRVRDIGKYLGTREAAFPNSIILAANYHEEDGLIEEDDALKWRIEGHDPDGDDSDCVELIIPSSRRLAAIVDGQHRLFGFTHASPKRQRMPILCSVFLDLPKPFQAYLFATINSTQRPVDKSQTYELFGYNVENEPETEWSPDKLAVFLARKMNTDEKSPLHGKILVAAENDFALTRSAARAQGQWMVSMATVVDGILRLISSAPKQDTYFLSSKESRSRADLADFREKDKTPLRSLYLETRDKVVYACVVNYFRVAISLFTRPDRGADAESFITKTVGVQALFDVLRVLAQEALESTDFSEEFFAKKLEPASGIDFTDETFQNPSGSGRTFIRQLLLYAITGEAPRVDGERKAQFDQLIGS